MIVEDFSTRVLRGDRIGVVGPNGSGKTTLLRILLGDEEPDAGTVERGHLVEFGYYDQQLRMLDDDHQLVKSLPQMWTAMKPFLGLVP